MSNWINRQYSINPEQPPVNLALASGLSYIGAYSAATTYAIGDVVADGSGNSFVSRTASNVGNALPSVGASNTNWQTLAQRGTAVSREAVRLWCIKFGGL